MPRSRLTTLDGSFLRVETASAHMHVGWKGTFSPRADGSGVTLAALRRAIAGRLRHAERFRQRLAFPPAGLGEPVWVDDEAFDLRRHVVAMAEADEVLPRSRFDELCDLTLSRGLDRRRPLWRIELAPRLADGSVGLLMQVHHAMVDGRSAVELALVLLDLDPDAEAPEQEERWAPERAPGATTLALEALADRGAESLRTVRGAARLAGSPARGLRLADTLRRAAMAVGEELVRPAPSSYVNCPIGPRRTLVHHTTALGPLLAARGACGPGRPRATLNDVALCVVAGALRDLSMRAGRTPEALRVMVPVSTRRPDEALGLGNRISFVFVELPVHLHRPADRLTAIVDATRRAKAEDRAGGGDLVLGALGVLPDPLKDRAARLAASPRLYNLTVSNVPGPRVPVYLLGCELREAAPVVPLPERHALSVGMFSYRDRLTFGIYADPTALPQVAAMPAALGVAVRDLRRLAPPSATPSPATAPALPSRPEGARLHAA
jgi:WS/DGAT/MGAT family acyltransferase